MKVLVDGRWLREDGIGRFSKEVIKELDSVRLLKPHISIFHPLEQLKLLIQLKKLNPDIYFSPGTNPPVLWNGPFIFAIHDLIPVKFESEVNFSKKIYYNTIVRLAAKKAKAIVTVSEFTKGELIDWLSISPDKIKVISNGVSKRYNPNAGKFDPGYPYIFYVGNKKPHKNLKRAVAAYAVSGASEDFKFILSGNPSKELVEVAKKYNVEENVIFTGFISEDELPKYYCGASAFLFPSLYEGFGLPVLEAMACGIPVVTSNLTSIPEVAGDAVDYINPQSIDSIKEGLERVLGDESYQVKLKERGLRQSSQFSWTKSAMEVKKILNNVVRP